MGIRDDEGLIFQDIRKKVLNEGEPQRANQTNNDANALPVNEVINHIHVNMPVFAGVKLGIGFVLGGFVGLIIASFILGVLGYILFSLAGGSVADNNISMLSLLSNFSI
ncbi:MAG: hypothetical protein ABIG84_01525 [archaeon]